jgi:hypothetical protein
MLVGARNEGALTGTHVNEHAELISECGTHLGSVNQGRTFNAVSGSGNRVYFTAKECSEESVGSGPEVSELYARTDHSQTLPISEPTGEQRAACKAPAETVRDGGSRPSLGERCPSASGC